MNSIFQGFKTFHQRWKVSVHQPKEDQKFFCALVCQFIYQGYAPYPSYPMNPQQKISDVLYDRADIRV